jgi:hypothetical protein
VVYFFKIITGEELIAQVDSELDIDWEEITVRNPVKLALTQNGAMMIPYSPFLKSDEIEIRRDHVIFHGEVDTEIYNAYNSKYGSGIVVAGNEPKLRTLTVGEE